MSRRLTRTEADLNNEVTRGLLQHLVTETDGLALWWEIRRACARVVNADTSELYLSHYDDSRRELQRVQQARESSGDGTPTVAYRIGRSVPIVSHTNSIAVQAAR